MSLPQVRHTTEDPMKIAVLISGSGRTLKNLIDRIEADKLPVRIERVVSSSVSAKGLQFAEENRIPSDVVTVKQFPDRNEFSTKIYDSCREAGIELIVMAGFLKQVVVPFDFENRVINIHPSLIPSFCGTGYYGMHVHRAAIEYGVKVSGCTIHLVDDHYDHGPIIHQEVVPVSASDTPDDLAARVFQAECQAYPRIIGAIAEGRISVNGREVTVS